jgi:acyl-CoA synthetase (AMP-forming)/AMP-acid ligase II
MNHHLPAGGSRPDPLPEPPPLHLWLHEAATRWPERPALVHVDGDTLDYRALAAAVTARAREMSAAGLRAGDRVALAATRSIATVVDILAAVEPEVNST